MTTLGRLVYCVYTDCRIAYPAHLKRPELCPMCGRSAVWSETAPAKPSQCPGVPWRLSESDLEFLLVQRIKV